LALLTLVGFLNPVYYFKGIFNGINLGFINLGFGGPTQLIGNLPIGGGAIFKELKTHFIGPDQVFWEEWEKGVAQF